MQLKNDTDKAVNAHDDERERIRGQELLVGDDLSKKGDYKDFWTLTAELSGPTGVNLLCPEIVVHGEDSQGRRGKGQGVTITADNVGVAKKIGAEIQKFLPAWSDAAKEYPIQEFGDYGTWKNNPGKFTYKYWGQQVTAPIPLSSLYAMLPESDHSGMTQQKHNLVITNGLVKVTFEDLPEKLRVAGRPQVQLDALMALLSLMVSYIKEGPRDTVAKGLKHLTPIMPRTDFATMVLSCADTISAYGDLSDLVAQVCAKRTIDFKGSTLYWKGHTLAATDWIRALPGKDLVAEYDKSYRHGQVGGLGSKTEHLVGRPKVEAPVFEFRDIGSCVSGDIDTWMDGVETEVRRIHKDAVVM